MQDKQAPSSIVGRRLRERREALGLAQEKVGVAIGLDESSARARISRYELGVHEPSYHIARQLASALRVPAAYLYCEDDTVAAILLKVHGLPKCELVKLLALLTR